MKKKTFFSFFIKRWMVFLIIAGIVCGAITYFTYEKIQKQIMEGNLSDQSSMRERFEDVELLEKLFGNQSGDISEEEKKAYENEMLFWLSTIDGVLYDPVGEEILCPKEELVVVMFREIHSEEWKYYRCPVSFFGFSEEEKEKFLMYNEEYASRLQDVYVKGTDFFPGHLVLKDLRNQSEEFIDGEVIGEIDLTPENVDGYTKINIEDTTLGIVKGYSYVSEGMKEYLGVSQANLAVDGLGEIGADRIIGNKGYTSLSVTIGEENYYIIGEFSVEVWEQVQCEVVEWYVSLFLLSIACGIISGLLAFKRYEMLRYQRNLTASLAHDLKSPLAVVSGYVENLTSDVCKEKSEDYLKKIENNVQQMNTMITDILELSRMEGKITRKSMTREKLESICAHILEKYETQIKEKELTVNMTGDMTLRCNRAAMERAIENLLVNAILYSPKKATIDIKFSRLQIVISNPYEHVIACTPKKLCEPFVKGEESRGNTGGTGVGLSIAKNIIEMHKHRFWVRTDNQMFVVKIMI